MAAITIIGTSHIAKESVEAVKKYIEEKKPDIVAVELDKKRFYGLVKKKKSRIRFSDLRRIGVKGYLFALIGAYVSKKLGEIVKSMPGDEMLAAIKTAKKNNLKIVLIDRDIEITLARFSRFLTWKEKWRFVVDLFNGLIFRKKEMEKLGFKGNIDLRKVPSKDLIHKLVKRVKDRYPNVYRVLIHERDVYMAMALKSVKKLEPDKKILAVVGAGHEEGLMRELKKK